MLALNLRPCQDGCPVLRTRFSSLACSVNLLAIPEVPLSSLLFGQAPRRPRVFHRFEFSRAIEAYLSGSKCLEVLDCAAFPVKRRPTCRRQRIQMDAGKRFSSGISKRSQNAQKANNNVSMRACGPSCAAAIASDTRCSRERFNSSEPPSLFFCCWMWSNSKMPFLFLDRSSTGDGERDRRCAMCSRLR